MDICSKNQLCLLGLGQNSNAKGPIFLRQYHIGKVSRADQIQQVLSQPG